MKISKKNKTFKKKYLLYLLLILIIINSFFLFIKNNQKKKNLQIKQKNTKILALRKTQGKLILRTERNIELFSVNSEIPITINGYSTQSITGYDLIIKYDSSKINLKFYKNLNDNFLTSFKEINNKIIISGVKKLEVKKPIILDNTPLFKLNFEAKKLGKVNFEIEFIPGEKTDSNLINENTIDILEEVENMSIFIGEKIILNKNQPFFFENKNLQITLQEITLNNQNNCFDCVSQIKINFKSQNQNKTIDFKIGGIQGYFLEEKRIMNYILKLETIENNKVTLIISKLN